MKFANKFLKFCALSWIRKFLISGMILSYATASSQGASSNHTTGTSFARSIKGELPHGFVMKTPGVTTSDSGNYLRYKGRVYESGAQTAYNVGDPVDITNSEFDPTSEEYHPENEITMLNITLGDKLANDFIALSRWANTADLNKRQLILTDTSHISNECLQFLQSQEHIQDFVTTYNLSNTPRNIESLIEAIKKKYEEQLTRYEDFAKALHNALSGDKEWHDSYPMNSATHTEIMLIYKILEQCGISYNNERYQVSPDQCTSNKRYKVALAQCADNLKDDICRLSNRIQGLLPATIFSDKEMCHVCNTTLAGFYKLVLKNSHSIKTIFVGRRRKDIRKNGLKCLRMCDWDTYRSTVPDRADLESYINYLSALAKRMVQADNLLLPPTGTTTYAQNAIHQDTEAIIKQNKSALIDEYNNIVTILTGFGIELGVATTDTTGNELLASISTFMLTDPDVTASERSTSREEGTDESKEEDPTNPDKGENNTGGEAANLQNGQGQQNLPLANRTNTHDEGGADNEAALGKKDENLLDNDECTEEVPTNNSTPPQAPNKGFIEEFWEQWCKIM